MLATRVATAVVVLLVLVAAALWSPQALVAVAAAFAGATVFEWLRLAGAGRGGALWTAVLFAGALLAFELRGVRPSPPQLAAIAAIACAVWVALAGALVALNWRPVRIGRGLSTVLALLLVSAAWLSLTELLRHGVLWALSVLALVWIADIAAYFSGRAFGRRKLAPKVSPGKTWAGVWGALTAVVALADLLRVQWPQADLWSTRQLAASPALGVAALVAAVSLSIVGDLFESLIKRQAGAKDSGRLLPGHGGAWDRIDATLPVLPAAVLIDWWIRAGINAS